MTLILVVIENGILVLLLPLMVRAAAKSSAQAIDNRNMFGIPFCSGLSTICGVLLAVAILSTAGVFSNAVPAQLWGFDVHWQTGRLLVLMTAFLSVLIQGGAENTAGIFVSAVPFLLVCAGMLTLANGLVAIVGWRSVQAYRGLTAHVILSLSTALVFSIWSLTAIWALHWLNFWSFLVLLCVIEIRRRESDSVRLSF